MPFSPYTSLLGVYCPDTQSFYEELTVWFVSGGAAMHGPNVLWSTPPIQKSTIETTSMESPSMLELFMSDRLRMFQVECLNTVLFPKSLYRLTIRCRQV